VAHRVAACRAARNQEASRREDRHREDRNQEADLVAVAGRQEDRSRAHPEAGRAVDDRQAADRPASSGQGRQEENLVADPSRQEVHQAADHPEDRSHHRQEERLEADPSRRQEDHHHPVGNRRRPTRARSRSAWGTDLLLS
jgi:hypothetical protein